VRLDGKIALVTGAGSGIGRATALEFARAGADLAVCDVNPAGLEETGAAIRALGRNVLARTVDVASRDQMRAFAEDVHRAHEAVDVLMNNAGVGLGGGFLDTSLDDWDWLLGINLRGVVHGCHHFVPPMVARGTGGHVINIASILGIYPAPNVTAYVASKFAVLGFSQSLRGELAPHKIGVTAICPGLIDTAIVADGRMAGELGGRRERLTSIFKKGASPTLVADAIVGAVATNPAVRTVGRDAWALHQLTKLAPRTVQSLGARFAKRFAG
jgi:NAD(P)-dependent dehydrogenase (short-subunit alcohol dehydrogenase family)